MAEWQRQLLGMGLACLFALTVGRRADSAPATRAVLKSLAAVCVSLLGPVQASAQPLFGSAESLECVVANADIVVVGKVVEFGEGEQADERGARPVTIAVEETLKGEHRERLRVRLSHPVSALADWKDHSCRLLVARGVPPTATRVIWRTKNWRS
jgi:hypothetical protein